MNFCQKRQGHIQNPLEHLHWSFFAKMFDSVLNAPLKLTVVVYLGLCQTYLMEFNYVYPIASHKTDVSAYNSHWNEIRVITFLLYQRRQKNYFEKQLFSFFKYEEILINIKNMLRTSYLNVKPCILYNKKYMIASTQKTNTEIFTFISVLVFKLLNRKGLFLNRKNNKDC